MKYAVLTTAVAVLLIVTDPNVVSAESAWPQFRGPDGDGIASVVDAPVHLDETTRVWQVEIEGKGWSSPVVADGLIWITTAIEFAANPDEIDAKMERSGVPPRQRKSRSIAGAIELRLIAVSFDDGDVRHDILLRRYEDPDAIHSLNSYASPTPVIDGDHIYCAFGTYGTFCVDRSSAEIVWQHETTVKHAVGPGSSPVVDGSRLVLILDGMERQRVLALDKTTGREVWQSNRPPMDAPDGDQKKAYCTPVRITDSNGREQLLCLASQWMVSLDPETGEEWWRCYHGKGFSIVPRPVYADDVVYFATGFGKPQLWAVDVTGEGDVSQTHVRWREPKGMPQKPSPLLHDGLIYVVSDNGVAVCLRAEDGEQVWKQRLGGNYSASPLLVGDHLYFCSQEGDVIVMRVGGGEIVAKNDLGQRIMASPAAVEGGLIVRTEAALHRFATDSRP